MSGVSVCTYVVVIGTQLYTPQFNVSLHVLVVTLWPAIPVCVQCAETSP